MEISKELAFSVEEYRSRIANVRKAMARTGVDVLLLHSLPSICYVTGYQTAATRSYNCFVITAQEPHELVIERDEQYNVEQTSWVDQFSTFVRWVDPVQVTIDVVKRLSGNSRLKIGIEKSSRYLTTVQYLQLHSGLAPSTLVDASDLVPWLMLVKSSSEVDCIRRAARITATGMKAAVDAVRVGKTDNFVASLASKALIGGGSEYMSSDPIICVGQNSSIPHGHYANRTIAGGDTVLLEMSACVKRYSAPLMRAVSLGKPSPAVQSMASSCKEALHGVISGMRPGSPFSHAAAVGKLAIEKAGKSMIFHGTYAYSMGLGFPGTSWADCPLEVRDNDQNIFVSGMVFHLPMSLRDAGRAGVAFSETVAITDDGCEVLTDFEQELFIK